MKTRTLRWYAQRGLIKRKYIDGRPVYPVTGVDVLKKWMVMKRFARLVA